MVGKAGLQVMMLLTAVFGGSLASAQAVAAAGIDIALKHRASLPRVQIMLGDVAELTSADETLVLALKKIRLGRLPPSGQARLGREQIEKWIASQMAWRHPPLTWSGAQQVSIDLLSRTIAGEQLMESARQALESWLDGRVERSAIVPDAPVPELKVPDAGSLRLQPRLSTLGNQVPARSRVWVDVWVDDTLLRTIAVQFSIQAYRPVYVASAELGAGRTVQTEQFEIRKVNVAGLGVPVAVRDAPAAWRLRRAMAPGGVLLESQIEEAPAVVRGQAATLVSRFGAIVLESTVQVLQDGLPGQMVRVKPALSNEAVTARVIKAGLLEMNEK